LLLSTVRPQLKEKTNALKSDGRFFGYTESTSEIQVALRNHAAFMNRDPDRSRYRAKRYSSAGNQRLEEHVSRTDGKTIPAGCRMQTRLHRVLSSLNFARDAFAYATLSLER